MRISALWLCRVGLVGGFTPPTAVYVVLMIAFLPMMFGPSLELSGFVGLKSLYR